MVRGALQAGGARLRFFVEGEGIPALIPGSAIYYPRTFSPLLGKALCLAFVDVRHFAEVDFAVDPETITLEGYIQDIENLRIEVGFERFLIVGHSHHGNLALEYAKRYPSRVSHVVLIGTPPVGVPETIEAADSYWETQASQTRKERLAGNLGALEREFRGKMSPAETFVAHYIAEGPKYWADPAFDASGLWAGVPVDMDAIGRFRSFFSDKYILSWNAENLQAPVLAVMGQQDFAVPHTLWDEVRPGLKNLTYHLFEHSGHTPQLEEPEKFNQVLMDFISRSS